MLRHELDYGPTQVCNDDILVEISEELYHNLHDIVAPKVFIFHF